MNEHERRDLVHYLDRRDKIMEMISDKGSVKVAELAKHFDIGEATIRRDLKFLADQYDVQLTYGGAFANKKSSYGTIAEMNINMKKTQNLEKKKSIAKKAAELIEDGDTIALNSGSTVELILDYLESMNKLNVITLSLNVAVRASTLTNIDVYMPGGKLRSFSGAFYGKDTEDFLRKFNVNKAFFGAVAVCMENGVTHPVLEEVQCNRALMDISQEKYLTADSTKFDKVSLVKMADLVEFEGIIIDDEVDEKYIEFAEINDIKII